MKKFFPHIIYVPIIAIVMVFASIKAKEADMMSSIASMNEKLAERSAQEAKIQAQESEEMAAEVRKQERLANEALLKAEAALENCK